MPAKEIERFVARYAEYQKEKEAAEASPVDKIHVDEIASKVAAFYEKVRNVIEYRDAHLLRRGAIERILRRRILLKNFKEDFAEPLIKELIRSGHLANDTVPETKIADVQAIIDNLLFLLAKQEDRGGSPKNASSNWLVGMFASRIEEELFPYPEGAFLSEMMYGTLREHLVLKNVPLSEPEADLQLFVAVQRALFRPDASQLEYALLKVTHPQWGNFTEPELMAIAENLGALRNTVRTILQNPYGPYFSKLCSREKIIFQLIGELVFEGESLEGDFSSSLKYLYDKDYRKAGQQLRRIAFLSVISFLISKMVVAVAIEVPLDQYLYHAVSLTSMAVNIFFPPLLMLIIVASIRLPSKENFALIETAVEEVVSGDDERKYVVVVPKKKGIFTRFFIYLAYGIALLAVLDFITRWLIKFNFSPASIIIFLLFTSMVVATGVKVRNRAKEMSLEKEKASLWSFLVDLVIVPFMTIGRWIISGLSKFNVLVIAFNFLIELPLQFFLEFLENFREFIKARKDEIN